MGQHVGKLMPTRMRDRRGRGEDGSIFRGLLAVAMIYASAWATWYAVKWIVWAVMALIGELRT